MARFDLLVAKEMGFTLLESVTMKDWLLTAVTAIMNRDRALGAIAEEILDTGLAAEHWLSLLNEDPELRTREERDRLEQLERALDRARKKFSDYMKQNPERDNTDIIERPNAP